MDKQAVIEATRRWISSMVIGLDLCPFAQRVFQTDKIRYVVTLVHDEIALLQDLAAELKALVSSPISTVETTLLIHPCALGTRENATKEMLALGELAIVPLQRLLDKPPSAEARQRAVQLLEKLSEPQPTPQRQRVLEAIDLLEELRTAAALKLLQEIERDALVPSIRREARRALQRLLRDDNSSKD
jgi:hypothetical protein